MALMQVSRRGAATGRVIGIIVAIALAGYFGYNRFTRRDDLKGDLYGQMMQVVQEAPQHQLSPEYVQTFESAHERAFSAAYTSGGRRGRARFDHDAYLREVFGALIQHATDRGYEEDKAYFEALLAVNLAQ